MIIDFSKLRQKVNDIRIGNIKEGLKIDIPDIDQYLRFKPANFNVILGHANVGKTTVILFLMLLYSKRLGIRWLVYSSENEAHSIARKLLEFLEQEPINKIGEKAMDSQMDFINDHFKIIDNQKLYTYKDLIELAEQIKKGWDYQGFLIDPYNSLIKDGALSKSIGGHEYDYQATTELRQFCKKNNITTYLNTHANTNALRNKHPHNHPYDGHPIPPMASDVEGGGKFVNRADDFIVIHRYIQHPTEWMVSHIHVRKVKEIETGGRPTPLDEPIRLRSMRNNVGFAIDGVPLLEKPIIEDFKQI